MCMLWLILNMICDITGSSTAERKLTNWPPAVLQGSSNNTACWGGVLALAAKQAAVCVYIEVYDIGIIYRYIEVC